MQQFIAQWWNSQSGTWVNSQRATFTYNSSGKTLTATFEIWSNGVWVNSSKQSNTYDSNGYLIYNLSQIWDNASVSWKNSGQINYTNNANGTIQQFISQMWDSPSATWINSQRATFTYINTTGMNEASDIQFLFFPNPANEVLNLILGNNSETKIEIRDLTGRLVFTYSTSKNSAILNIKNLPSDVYFLYVYQTGMVNVARFIKN